MAAARRRQAEAWCSIPEKPEGVCILEIRKLQQWVQALQRQCQSEDSIVNLTLIPHVQSPLQQIAEAHSS